MKPYLESQEWLPRIKIRHVFFREKAGDAVGIKLGLGDVGVNYRIIMTEHDDIVLFCNHALIITMTAMDSFKES